MPRRPYQDNRTRENKRLHQLTMTARLKDLSTLNPNLCTGTVVFLSGPNPTEAVRYFQKYGVGDSFVGAEKNYNVYLQALLDKPKNIILKNENVFEVIKQTDNIRGIDFDFCSTVTDELAQQLINVVLEVKNPTVWFRVTSSMRGSGGKKGLEERKQLIKETIEKNSKFTIIDECSIVYKDTVPMDTWQVVLRDEQRKEEGTMRTFRELTAEERDMVRTLVESRWAGRRQTNYTDEQVATLFNLSPISISAVKANLTRGN